MLISAEEQKETVWSTGGFFAGCKQEGVRHVNGS